MKNKDQLDIMQAILCSLYDDENIQQEIAKRRQWVEEFLIKNDIYLGIPQANILLQQLIEASLEHKREWLDQQLQDQWLIHYAELDKESGLANQQKYSQPPGIIETLLKYGLPDWTWGNSYDWRFLMQPVQTFPETIDQA